MKSIKLLIIFFILIIFSFTTYSQQSFELIYGSNKSELLEYTFEDNNNEYVSVGLQLDDFGVYPARPLAIKFDNSGNILFDKLYPKQDTGAFFSYGIKKDNGNYLIIGMMATDANFSLFNILFLCELNSNLEIVWEKMHEIPLPYINFEPFGILKDSNSIVIRGSADTTLSGSNNFISFFRVDYNGEILDEKFYDNWKDLGNRSSFLFNFDSTGYILLGDATQSSNVREWVEFDKDFEVTNYMVYIDPDNHVNTPASAKWLPNGNLFCGNATASSQAYIKIMDQQFNTLNDTTLNYYEPTYIITENGIDYTDPDNIWLGTFFGVPTFFTGEEVFRVHIFDSNAHLKGMKVYGGDMRYWFFYLKSTSDGGCILTGQVPDTNGSYNTNAYILKVMPDDILTNAEETPFEFDRDVSVYPNPFNKFINVETARKHLRLSLFDVNGQTIYDLDISANFQTKLNTGNLKSGFYFYTITDNSRIIQSGKLIKK